MPGITLNATQLEPVGAGNQICQVKSWSARKTAGTTVSAINVYHHIQLDLPGLSGFHEISNRLGMVNYRQETRTLPRQGDELFNFGFAHDLRSDQDFLNTLGNHDFCFAEFGDTNSFGSSLKLLFGNDRAFVSFGVRAEIDVLLI